MTVTSSIRSRFVAAIVACLALAGACSDIAGPAPTDRRPAVAPPARASLDLVPIEPTTLSTTDFPVLPLPDMIGGVTLSSSNMSAINESNWVAGTANYGGAGPAAMLWRGGEFELLFGPLEPRDTEAFGLNDAGMVVGRFNGITVDAGFRWEDGAPPVILPNPPNLGAGLNFEARDVDENGDILVWYDHSQFGCSDNLISGSTVLSAPYTFAAYNRILPPECQVNISAMAIHLGVVVGSISSLSANPSFGAFSWNGGAPQVIGGSSAADVKGDFYAGTVFNGSLHAARWEDGVGPQDLGTLGGATSRANAVNARGWVVGNSQTASGETHAFLWTPEDGMIDLGTLGGNFSSAKDINENGLILGDAAIAGTNRRVPVIWVIDQPPTIEITNPADESEFNEGVSISFQADANDQEDGVLSGESVVWMSDQDGNLGTGTTLPINTLTPGTHVITATATDSKGQSTPASITVTINALPSVNITAPADGSDHTTGENISFEASANDPEDGALSGASITWSSDVDGALGQGSPLVLNTLTPGAHVITVTATDSKGATDTDVMNINVDSPPTVGITAPADGADFDFLTEISFQANANDLEDGPLSGAALSWSSDKDGVLGNGTPLLYSTLTVGAHVITVTATDSKGHAVDATINLTINAPADQPPTVQITAPADNAEFVEGQAISFEATANDDEDGPLTGNSLTWAADPGGDLGSGSPLVVSTLALGAHVVTVTATDAAGNETTAQVNVVITAAPEPPDTPEEQAEEIAETIEEMVATGDIPPDAAAGLLAKLRTIQQDIEKGKNPKPITNKLQAFIREVQSLMADGSISAETGQALIAAATALQASISP